ncbi:hypothetical protein T05_1021 [Trichinella murrelli]|uniref:Uncharacterized protein n=1 Tax=Trichinella murrelli TaxID=144512 RepID=A0A0V0U1L7_9BILA|nr:hypothetical protein T05_1021 [Trichinella murrelli]
MLKRETIIDRRPTTTTRSVNVNWFQNRHTIAEQHRQVYRIIVDDRSGRKGGHRTNTTTSNDNDYWPSPTTAASCEGNLLRKRRPVWSLLVASDDDILFAQNHAQPGTHKNAYRQSTEQRPNIGAESKQRTS